MHTFSETGAGVPAFLAKLWRLVEDPETNNLICWSKDGRSFIIQNQAQFARELLPLNYKHNNMASFIRQLNMYGFHKITSIDNGGLKFDRDEMEFTHPCFKRNCPYLLEHIKRKIASTKSIDDKSALKPEAVTKVLQDVKVMRGRQDSLDSRFSVMKQENEALWREIASLRQKHAKQQQIVNKLIQFLITIVQPQRNMTSVKRHMQLMINDTPDKTKLRKTSDSETECGPVIHELGEDLIDEVEPELIMPNSPFTRVTTPATPTSDPDAAHSPHNTERPKSTASVASQNVDFCSQSNDESREYLNPSSAINDGVNVGLVQTVTNDGSKIFYHITEVPDSQPHESNVSPVSYNEDNVLTTPMVREQMARSQMLKQNKRTRRSKNASTEENSLKESSTKVRRISDQQLTSRQQIAQQLPKPIQIKSEQDGTIDTMLYLNVYSNNRGVTPDSSLISPNQSEDSRQSNSNGNTRFLTSPITAAPANTTSIDNEFLAGNGCDLYNPNTFITNDIPTDIFEDNFPKSAEDNNTIDGIENLKKTQQTHLGRSTGNNGKFSSFLLPSSSEPSTSAAAAAANSLTNNGNNMDKNSSSSQSTLKNENGTNMALTKYKDNHDFMRDEVSGHLDIVQDELESLKDLLRCDVYSLDNNTLQGMSLNEINSIQNPKRNAFENNKHQKYLPPAMEEDILNKLFNESEILGPYGLHLSSTNDNNGSNDKRGSELMTYQPMYDLSDIINDQNDLDADVDISTGSTSPIHQPPKQEFNNSVLNTPYHE